MKKILIFMFCLFIALAFAGCKGNPENPSDYISYEYDIASDDGVDYYEEDMTTVDTEPYNEETTGTSSAIKLEKSSASSEGKDPQKAPAQSAKPTENSSKEVIYKDSGRPLIKSLCGENHVGVIAGFEVLHGYADKGTAITDKNDLKFLEKYCFSDMYPQEAVANLFVFPNVARITLRTYDSKQHTLFLLKDGSIIKKVGISDGDTSGSEYEIFRAEDEYMLDTEKFIKLLKKYGGYNP